MTTPPPGQPLDLAPGLRAVLAPNPSPMTADGTWSYLVGETRELALIDPGPDDPAHVAALLAALRPGQRIGAILVTHAHRDHTGATAALARATGAPVLAFGGAHEGRRPIMEALAASDPGGGTEGTDAGFHPDRRIADGEVIAGEGWRLTTLHTPGHLSGHLCFLWGDSAFSGDHVMGWNSSIVAPPDGDMGAYMTSLDWLAASGVTRLWPGHGAPVPDAQTRIKALAAHRRAREAAVLSELAKAPATATGIAVAIYLDLPRAALPAAALNVFAHLIDLTERGLAAPEGPLTRTARFQLR